jgi:hypothetical protein
VNTKNKTLGILAFFAMVAIFPRSLPIWKQLLEVRDLIVQIEEIRQYQSQIKSMCNSSEQSSLYSAFSSLELRIEVLRPNINKYLEMEIQHSFRYVEHQESRRLLEAQIRKLEVWSEQSVGILKWINSQRMKLSIARENPGQAMKLEREIQNWRRRAAHLLYPLSSRGDNLSTRTNIENVLDGDNGKEWREVLRRDIVSHIRRGMVLMNLVSQEEGDARILTILPILVEIKSILHERDTLSPTGQ